MVTPKNCASKANKFSFKAHTPPALDIEKAETFDMPTDGKLISYAGYYFKKKVKGVGSRHTQRSKLQSLQKFVNFFHFLHPTGSLKLWDLATTQAFMETLDQQYKIATLYLHMDNLSSFATFLERKQVWCYEDSPVRGVRRPTLPELRPQGICLVNEKGLPSRVKVSSEEIFEEMVTTAKRLIKESKKASRPERGYPPCPYRDLAIIMTLYYGAMRVDEMCGLLKKQMQPDEDTGSCFFPGVKCKGNKRRTIILRDRAYTAILRYMNSEERENGTASPYIFLTWSGRRLSQPYAWTIVNTIARATDVALNTNLKSLIRRAGEKWVKISVHPHSFRHERTYTLLKSRRISESTIAEDILGHTSTRYIARYGKRPIREIAEKLKDI